MKRDEKQNLTHNLDVRNLDGEWSVDKDPARPSVWGRGTSKKET